MPDKTQSQLILEWMQRGNSITPLEALYRFQCFRLGARIHDLKKTIPGIVTEMVKENGKHFARYSIEKHGPAV